MLSWSSTRKKICFRTDWKSLMIRGKSARRARLNSEDMESDEKTRGAGASRGVQGVRIARLCQLRLSWTSNYRDTHGIVQDARDRLAYIMPGGVRTLGSGGCTYSAQYSYGCMLLRKSLTGVRTAIARPAVGLKQALRSTEKDYCCE
jgi:hypothetical protein